LEFNKSNGFLFDGIDWDYEGHDDLRSPTAKFTLETLNIMADFSVEAKKAGLIVAMAPAESYLDSSFELQPNNNSIIIDYHHDHEHDHDHDHGRFSLRLDLPPRAWTPSYNHHATESDVELVTSAGFSHAGRQCYAYVLARAGIDTFDWISIQLYEAYSPFAHDVHRRGVDATEAIMVRVRRLVEGYTVSGLPLLLNNDSSTSSLSKVDQYEVKVPPSKLVVGIANGWADGLKFCKVGPSAVRLAYESTLTEYGEGFLGVMFWTIEEEGKGGGGGDDDDDDDDNSRLTHSLRSEFENIGLQQLSDEL